VPATFLAAGALGVLWAAGAGAFMKATRLAPPAREGGAARGGSGEESGPEEGEGERERLLSGAAASSSARAPLVAAATLGVEASPAGVATLEQHATHRHPHPLDPAAAAGAAPAPASPPAGGKAGAAWDAVAAAGASSSGSSSGGSGGGTINILGVRVNAQGQRQVAVLCAAHGCMGYGFFLMQVRVLRGWRPRAGHG
jgi:hypothetical protein